jgi:hypothetical protein
MRPHWGPPLHAILGTQSGSCSYSGQDRRNRSHQPQPFFQRPEAERWPDEYLQDTTDSCNDLNMRTCLCSPWIQRSSCAHEPPEARLDEVIIRFRMLLFGANYPEVAAQSAYPPPCSVVHAQDGTPPVVSLQGSQRLGSRLGMQTSEPRHLPVSDRGRERQPTLPASYRPALGGAVSEKYSA